MSPSDRPEESGGEAQIARVKRGSLYVPAALHERYFAGLSTVILLRRDDHLLVMPVHDAAAGGYLLKIRNPAGDRVVDAMDFFRDQGLDDFFEAEFGVAWNGDHAALVAENLFENAN